MSSLWASASQSLLSSVPPAGRIAKGIHEGTEASGDDDDDDTDRDGSIKVDLMKGGDDKDECSVAVKGKGSV